MSAGIRVLTGNELSEERVAAPDPTERVLTQFNLISRMPSADPRAPSVFILQLTNNIHTPASTPGFVRNPVTSATDTAEHIAVPGWKKRNVGVEGPKTRTPPSDKSAIERRLMEMKDRSSVQIFEPVVGTNFDSCQEAYDFL